jgi:hypothetical protein
VECYLMNGSLILLIYGSCLTARYSHSGLISKCLDFPPELVFVNVSAQGQRLVHN